MQWGVFKGFQARWAGRVQGGHSQTNVQPTRVQTPQKWTLNGVLGAFMLNFWGQNQRFQTWLEQNAVASMLIFE